MFGADVWESDDNNFRIAAKLNELPINMDDDDDKNKYKLIYTYKYIYIYMLHVYIIIMMRRCCFAVNNVCGPNWYIINLIQSIIMDVCVYRFVRPTNNNNK